MSQRRRGLLASAKRRMRISKDTRTCAGECTAEVLGTVVWNERESSLFEKAVPQLEDWMVAWAACKTNQSWRAVSSNAQLFHKGSFSRRSVGAYMAYGGMVDGVLVHIDNNFLDWGILGANKQFNRWGVEICRLVGELVEDQHQL